MIKLNFRSIFLEALGTFFIVFSCSFGITVYENKQIDEIGLALLNGFTTMIMVWLARNATMGQFNPVLTILLLLLKKIKVGSLTEALSRLLVHHCANGRLSGGGLGGDPDFADGNGA